MNYNKIYENLIQKRKDDPITSGYKENHHILPRSIGGTDDKENLVFLTGREHWIAHLLLHKIHKLPQTAHACNMMAMRCEERGIAYIKNSRLYELIRIEHAKLVSKSGKKRVGRKNGSYGTMWICNLKTKKNKKIKKDGKIPDGWIKGRNKWNEVGLKKCRCCGQTNCMDKQCMSSRRINTLANKLGFDKKCLGTTDYFKELNKIKKNLYNEYYIKEKSIEEIKEKYKFKTNESLRLIYKSFGFNLRKLGR